MYGYGSSVNYLMRGSCWHTLTTDIDCPEGVGDDRFAIVGKFKIKKPTVDRSYLEKLRVKLKLDDGSWIMFNLDQGPTASYIDENGVEHAIADSEYPYSQHGMVLRRSVHPHTDFGGEFEFAQVVITLAFPPDNMMLRWDGEKRLKITLPPAMHGHVCGMCGPIEDFTGDLLIGPHDNATPTNDHCYPKAAGLPQHATTHDKDEFAGSWYVQEPDEDADCLAECNAGP